MDMSLRNRLGKYAIDNGFSLELGENNGWLLFDAHAVPAGLALSVASDKSLLVGTSHLGAGEELLDQLDPAPYSHEGFTCFTAPSESDLFRIIGRIWSLASSLPNEPLAEFERLVTEDLSTTEVERLRKERIGQNVFRKALMNYWSRKCAVTGVGNPALLRASHIIPWAKCNTNIERLNVHNGILLIANLDAAFDAGLISFDDKGKILISSKLSSPDCMALGLVDNLQLIRLSEPMREKLLWHRENLFEIA